VVVVVELPSLGVVVVVAVIVVVVVELLATARRVGVHFVFVDIYRFVAHVSQGEGPSIMNLNPLLRLSSLSSQNMSVFEEENTTIRHEQLLLCSSRSNDSCATSDRTRMFN